jgi:hypothetical protein
MLGRNALGPTRAGRAQHRSNGCRVQVVAPVVVLSASPARPDGHHLEADEIHQITGTSDRCSGTLDHLDFGHEQKIEHAEIVAFLENAQVV